MSKIYFVLLLSLLTACTKNESNGPAVNDNDPVISLEAKSGIVTGVADFGVFSQIDGPKLVTFKITNNGTEPLVGPASLDNADFSIAYQNCPVSLAVKASCQIKRKQSKQDFILLI